LSNDQGAALVAEVVRRSAGGRLRHVVQLHLSRQCNRPELARAAAEPVAAGADFTIHTAAQDAPGPTLSTDAPGRRIRRARGPRRPARLVAHPWLPGLEP
jgi:hypothetical protein